MGFNLDEFMNTCGKVNGFLTEIANVAIAVAQRAHNYSHYYYSKLLVIVFE